MRFSKICKRKLIFLIIADSIFINLYIYYNIFFLKNQICDFSLKRFFRNLLLYTYIITFFLKKIKLDFLSRQNLFRSDILPSELLPYIRLAGEVGLEPTTFGLASILLIAVFAFLYLI